MNPVIVHACPPSDTPHIPVAIVGAGACGLVAALVLAGAGIDCVVLERDAAPAGSTALSSGFIPAPDTRVQKTRGISDNAAQFAADIQAKAKGTAAPLLVQAYAQAIGPALDLLEEKHGLQFELLQGFLYPGHSALRMHAVPEKTGAGLMTRLQRAADAASVPVLTNALVCELWVGEDGVLTGLGYQRPDGTLERLACAVLLLACNGFGGNPALVRELLPEMRDAIFAGHTGNDGSAIRWGRALGARLADLGGYQGHGSWVVPQGILMSWAVMVEGGMQLNNKGLRFHDETQGYSEAAVAVLAQPGGVAWNVFDERLLALARSFPDFCVAEEAGALHRADNRAALAALIGCAEADLSPDLARLAAPYFAVRVTGALFHTQGGLDIDAKCRVLREDGQVFANLLAAGGAARGVSGNAVWGYLSGNGLLSAIAGGYIAAHTAQAILETTA
ncbi:MAG: FAD-dependent oxidoreductase [Polaromonas sp.]|uniref:FAD-dependent oxidoreductase n=1 Tax=Polaromonas sp. TaxID=1869339 RepID=UPI002735C4D5|nr:FAD-dependent oxidoreductase [Polaromonas sp.]MDP2819952.1 FAD-dependent oxidoreductase [Polaromonas sp.]